MWKSLEVMHLAAETRNWTSLVIAIFIKSEEIQHNRPISCQPRWSPWFSAPPSAVLLFAGFFDMYHEGKCSYSCRATVSLIFFFFINLSDSVDAKAFISGLQNTLTGKLCLREAVTHECKPILQFSCCAFHFNKGSLTETRWWWKPHWFLVATRIRSARWTNRTFGWVISGSACPAGTRSRTIQLDKHQRLPESWLAAWTSCRRAEDLAAASQRCRMWRRLPTKPKCADKFRSES